MDAVKSSLNDAAELERFGQELAEMLDWVEDKEQRLRMQLGREQQAASLEDKLDRLKRQQALQSELAANGSRVDALRLQMERLRAQPHAEGIMERAEELLRRWAQLNGGVRQLDAALEEARDLLELEQLADRLCAFVRAKEGLINAEELGGDMEHCQTL